MEAFVLEDIYNKISQKVDTKQQIKYIDELNKNHLEAEIIIIYNYLLKKVNSIDVISYLIKELDNLRILCVKAITNHKNTDVISSLLYCMNNKEENYRVRLACADALVRIGNKYAVTPLINLAKDETEKSIYLRESAVSALSMLGDKSAVDPLINILETKQGILNKFSFLKEKVIEALIKIGFYENERAFRAIKEALKDESIQVRINAIEALMSSDHPNSFSTIKECLYKDKNLEVRKNAMIALYNLTDRKILDEIILSTEFPDELKNEAVSIINENEYEDEDNNKWTNQLYYYQGD